MLLDNTKSIVPIHSSDHHLTGYDANQFLLAGWYKNTAGQGSFFECWNCTVWILAPSVMFSIGSCVFYTDAAMLPVIDALSGQILPDPSGSIGSG